MSLLEYHFLNPEILFILKIDNNIIFRLEPSNFRQRIVSILGTKPMKN